MLRVFRRTIHSTKTNHSIQVETEALLPTRILLDVGGGRVVHHDEITMAELLLDTWEVGDHVMAEDLAFELILLEHLTGVPHRDCRHKSAFYKYVPNTIRLTIIRTIPRRFLPHDQETQRGTILGSFERTPRSFLRGSYTYTPQGGF